jgi:very-short-patch-repair endonuclease
MAAVLASSPSVASHWSAAWLWNLLTRRPGTLHVTCPRSRRARRAFVMHTADRAAVDRAVRDGIPVTSLPRTILDLAVGSHPKTVARRIERADAAKAFDLGEMRDLLDRTAGHRGRVKVRAALAAYRPERKFTRSGFERRFLEVVREAGLPEPAMNAFVAGHELDAWWEDARFAVELDVYETHGSRLSFEDDWIRDDELLLAGIETIRITETRLDREPDAVIASLRRHLARRN